MTISLVKVNVSLTSYELAAKQVLNWAKGFESRYVCAANVHMIMEAFDSPDFREVVNSADLVVPDGMPLVWMMRLKGCRSQERIYGPTLMLRVLESAVNGNIPVGFYGGRPEILEMLVEKMQVRYPKLAIAYAFSPPYRELNFDEDTEIIQKINHSRAQILFVGLGCPRQEKWMAMHRGLIRSVMLGVGAAFDFHTGSVPQSPAWLQKLGLEWSFRLAVEPRRLWRRYLYHNPRFIALAVADLLGLAR